RTQSYRVWHRLLLRWQQSGSPDAPVPGLLNEGDRAQRSLARRHGYVLAKSRPAVPLSKRFQTPDHGYVCQIAALVLATGDLRSGTVFCKRYEDLASVPGRLHFDTKTGARPKQADSQLFFFGGRLDGRECLLPVAAHELRSTVHDHLRRVGA